MIYFAQPSDGGPIKIGSSSTVDGRVYGLGLNYGKQLVVLLTIPGDIQEEQRIHALFAKERLRKTEQFRPSPELLEFIAAHQTADDPAPIAGNVDAPMTFIGTYAGLVSIRLQLTPAEREQLRVRAAASPHRTMAIYARELVRADLTGRISK